MTDHEKEKRARAKTVFSAALDLPEKERRAYVGAACAGDAALAREVLSLLAAADDGDSLLEGAVREDALGAVAGRSLVGRTVGSFRVLRLVAVGGMGAVYEAEQRSPRRTVALKVVRLGLESEGAVRRFRYESELLGRFRHPGIVQVFEAGVAVDGDESIPYFAMEYLPDAMPITAFASRRALALRDRLSLFARVCDAVQYGHQRGILHRDLKPDNILVDAAGDPKVIDFGVARAVGREPSRATAVSAAGGIVGTLQYMSPEQCGGDPDDLDLRSDVYSLGVVLYELACGRAPYDVSGLSLAEAVRRLAGAEPAPPRSVRPDLPRDVEAILGKALERSRDRRYASALDLARDVRRHLAGEPVEARPTLRFARVLRFARKRPAWATLVASLAVAALVLAATAIAVRFLALTPARISVEPSGRFASLVSRNGHQLHTWEAGESGVFAFASIVPRPESLGGGSLAFLGIRNVDSGTPNDLVAYDVRSPGVPIWNSRSGSLRAPPGAPPHPEAFFVLEWVLAADVWPGVPGDELIVCHKPGPFSQNAIRVFDLEGRVRFAAWHDGTVARPVWLEAAGILACCASRADHRWSERGVDLPEFDYPIVFFGLRLEDGLVADGGYLGAEGAAERDPALVYYRWLGPVEALAPMKRLRTTAMKAGGEWADGRHAQFYVSGWMDEALPYRQPTIALILDEKGILVHRWSGDAYRRELLSGAVPEPDVFRLSELSELPPPRSSLDGARGR